MTTPITTQFYYPNRMGRIILLSMEEVMGRNGVNAVLNLASLPALIPPVAKRFGGNRGKVP